MFGSSVFKPVLDAGHHHVGYLTTEHLVVPTGGTLTKGTWVRASESDEQKSVLASGYALGVLTQDITEEGHESLQAFKDKMIGKKDLPVKVGQAVSIRSYHVGSQLEFEGDGEAVPGNLVCTEGSGEELTDSDAVNTQLSFLNGCIKKAEAGDMVQLHLMDPGLTPETEGNLRIRVEVVSPYPYVAP